MNFSRRRASLCLGLLLSAASHAQLKPGEISPTAKVLDADKLTPFSYGVAVIEKGKATALIDRAGNIVVPYDQWSFTAPASSGMFLVYPTHGQHGATLVNTEGQMLIPPAQNNTKTRLSLPATGYARIDDSAQTYFLNAIGQKFPFDEGRPARTAFLVVEEMVLFNQFIDGKLKHGFLDKSGKVVIPARYDFAAYFSEGMAVVGKKDVTMQYGFINKQGKAVVPIRYSREPQSFSNGLAGVYPELGEDFTFAYIDKEGKRAIKIDKGIQGEKLESGLQGPKPPSFQNGYVAWRGKELCIVDTNGKVMGVSGFLQGTGIDPSELRIPFSITGGVGEWAVLVNKNLKVGLLNMRTRKLLPMIYDSFLWNAYDPVSGLLYARMRFEENGKQKWREGYINEDGVFVLVKPDRILQ